MTDVQILNPIEYPNWDSLLETNDQSTFFHTTAWARVLSESYGYKPLYFTIIDKGLSFSLPPRPKASHSAGSVSSQPPGLQASGLPCFFIELPYKMPQDHLLCIILRKKNMDIWKRKLH